MEIRLLFIISFIIFISSCASRVGVLGEPIIISKPVACYPHCDEIEEIVIIYAGEEKYGHYGGMLLEMVDNVASKNTDNRIEVAKIEFPVPKNWYAYRNTSVRVELFVIGAGGNDRYLSVGLKMVTPAGVFSGFSICDGGSDKTVDMCVQASIGSFVDEAIDGFLFDKGISHKSGKGD